jgi:translation initiation factor IF-2
VPVSAKERIGIQDLLENILVVAEVADLRADPDREAGGVVVEAELDKTKGSLATVLVQVGTLKQGDVVVAGETYGKIKAIFSDVGKRIRRVGPATPAEILGLNGVPSAGEFFSVVRDEKRARAQIEERRHQREREAQMARHALSLDDVSDQVRQGTIKDLNVILRTDVQGSIEPIHSSLERLSTAQVKVRILHSGTGSITESDIMLAVASKAIVIGFNTTTSPGALQLASLEGVDIRHYSIIYNLVDDVEKALKGMLEPEYHDVVQGHAEVRQIFRMGRRQAIAGCYLNDGLITRGDLVRVHRGGEMLSDSTVSSLRRFKDDVREVAAGYECGVGVEDFNDFKEGDTLEFYRRERVN